MYLDNSQRKSVVSWVVRQAHQQFTQLFLKHFKIISFKTQLCSTFICGWSFFQNVGLFEKSTWINVSFVRGKVETEYLAKWQKNLTNRVIPRESAMHRSVNYCWNWGLRSISWQQPTCHSHKHEDEGRGTATCWGETLQIKLVLNSSANFHDKNYKINLNFG